MKNGHKIAQWMNDNGADFVLDKVTSDDRACDISELRSSVQLAAEAHWIPLMDTRKMRHLAQKVIQTKAASCRFPGDVRRVVRNRDHIITHLVNESFYEAESHWDDDDWMFRNRKRFFPNGSYPSVAIVVADFDRHATSAALEMMGKVGRGVNFQINLASLDAKHLKVLSNESLKEIGRACGQAERTRQTLKSNRVFRAAFDLELQAVNGN
jgi:hypothetical protein